MNEEGGSSVCIMLGYMARFVFCRFFCPPAELCFRTWINALAWLGYLGGVFEGDSVWLVHLQLLQSDWMYLPLSKEIQQLFSIFPRGQNDCLKKMIVLIPDERKGLSNN